MKRVVAYLTWSTFALLLIQNVEAQNFDPAFGTTPWTALHSAETETVVRTLDEFRRMSPEELAELDTIPAGLLEMPDSGVDVMRARVTETYTVDGVGTDSVELVGWIAVRHGSPRLAAGESTLSWDTSIVDTQFVGMDLRGDSDLFGPIQIALDASRTSWGQVGKLDNAACSKFEEDGGNDEWLSDILSDTQ